MPEPTAAGIFDPHKGASPAPDSPPATPAPEKDPETGRFLKAGFSAHLVRQAKDSGLDDSDLKDMTPEEVREHVSEHRWNKRVESVFGMGERAREAARQPSAEGPVTAEPDAFSHGLNEQNATPEITAAVQKVYDHFDARIKALEAKFGPVAQHVQAQAQREGESFARKVERAFAKYPHIFGTGPIDKLDKDSPEFDFRMAAVKAHRKAGADADELEANVDSFVADRFAKKITPPETDDDEVREWEDGVLGRPTQRGLTEEPPGKEKAVQGLKANPALRGAPRRERPQRGQYLRHNGT